MVSTEISDLKLWSESELEEEEAACAYALHVSLCHMLPIVLNAAVELELFDIIARAGAAGSGGPHLSSSEIASQIPMLKRPPPHDDNDDDDDDASSVLDRMLQLLASHSLLTCSLRLRTHDGGGGGDESAERVYGLAPAGKYFVKSGGSSPSLASFVRLSYHPSSTDIWLHLKDMVVEGGNPFKKVHGMSLYQYMDKDPTLNEVFNKAMADRSTIFMNKILKTYKGFEGLTSLVDVGGGIGKTLNMIISMHPSIKGINFDLPHVIEKAPSYQGVEHVRGDMFSSIPKGDAIMMNNVLHNWGDEKCVKILKNSYNAVPKNGKVIIMEIMKPEVPESSIVAKYATEADNNMLLKIGGGGKERSEREFEALCKASGFSGHRVVRGAYAVCVIEFYK